MPDDYYPPGCTGSPHEEPEPEERCSRCGRLPDDCRCERSDLPPLAPDPYDDPIDEGKRWLEANKRAYPSADAGD